MLKTMFFAASAALVSVLTSSVHAEASPVASFKAQARQGIAFPHRGAKLLYDQSDNDNGTGIVAQNFEDSFDEYDSEAADDFKVPAGKTWKIAEVYVDGTYFDGTGSVRSFNVTFYSGKKGKVGKALKTCTGASYHYDGRFDFGSGYIKCKATLRKGTYFVAIQANIDFSVGGEWGWLTNNTVRRNPSLWRNPGDGFATGCTDFAPTTVCVPVEEGGDYAFALLGKAK